MLTFCMITAAIPIQCEINQKNAKTPEICNKYKNS